MVGTEIDLKNIEGYKNVPSIAADYIGVAVRKTVATENIKWTIKGFEEAWQKYINLHSRANTLEEKEKYLKVVKFHFKHQPTPEFLSLRFKGVDEVTTHSYKNNFTWTRAVYKKILILEEVK